MQISVPLHYQKKEYYDFALVLQRSTLPTDEPMEGVRIACSLCYIISYDTIFVSQYRLVLILNHDIYVIL